ncbi:MAG: HlyD family efflux transporter periplasmic adaptor subunit [Planctomycetia bacterium]|nr:HlyD family efflux transporter periplasmic adaptor subunit [Planctomycetia bacterium]
MWRFVGFVLLVLAGLAAVFYYKGQAEDNKLIQTMQKEAAKQVVATPLDAAKSPVVNVTTTSEMISSIKTGGAIVIPAELKPKEEMDLTFEVENANASILEIPKGIGSEVKPGDTLVILEDILAKARLDAQRIQAGEISESKIKAAENALEVYVKEVARQEQMIKTGATSQSELDLALARRNQAQHDIVKAKSEQKFEQARLIEVERQHALFQIKSRIPGKVIKVYKKVGNSVRNGESILQVINDKSLIVEGAFESGFSESLREGMTVILEPDNDREAKFVYNGHTGPVTGLALAPLSRFLASSSDDGSVILWDMHAVSSLPWVRLERGDQRRVACKCVAVSPAVNNDSYQILAGFADGSVIQWTVKITGTTPPKVEAKTLDKVHDQSVNTIAFRSDGKYAASGSDDRRVAIWNVNDGKKLYWVQADVAGHASTHFGGITSVIFSKDGQYLLTSGTDNAIRRWKLGPNNSELVKMVMGRTGDVRHINLADNGRYLFSEHGDELRLLDSQTLEPVSVLSSRRQGRFVQFAELSPNGEWAVAATDQGRNLLIRLPHLGKETDASGEIPVGVPGKTQTSTEYWLKDASIGAHFMLPEAVRSNCALFLPSAKQTYVFMGSTDNKIRVWQMPPATELTSPILAKLIFKSSQVESGTGLIRIQAEYDNSGKTRLETGKRVSMIVYPDAVDSK